MVCVMHMCVVFVVCACGVCVHVHVTWRRQGRLRTGLVGHWDWVVLLEQQAGRSLSELLSERPQLLPATRPEVQAVRSEQDPGRGSSNWSAHINSENTTSVKGILAQKCLRRESA